MNGNKISVWAKMNWWKAFIAVVTLGIPEIRDQYG